MLPAQLGLLLDDEALVGDFLVQLRDERHGLGEVLLAVPVLSEDLDPQAVGASGDELRVRELLERECYL